MVAAGFLNHICDQLGCDRRSTFIFFVLPSIGEKRNDSRNAFCTCNFAGMNHYTEFHEGCIHGPTSRRDDIHIVFAHGLCDAYVGLADAAVSDFSFG